MLDRVNVLVNGVMTLASGAFYLMLFTTAAPGFDARKNFGPKSYWLVRTGLSFFVAGSLLATLTMPSVTFPQFLRNVGIAVIFGWATWYHAKKWGVIYTPKSRLTGSFPVVK